METTVAFASALGPRGINRFYARDVKVSRRETSSRKKGNGN